jgi:gluconolactonase
MKMRRASLIAAIAIGGVLWGCAPSVLGSPGEGVKASYPEGPLWRDGRLYIAEMGANVVSSFSGRTKADFWKASVCGPTAIAPFGANGGFAVNCHLTGEVVFLSADGGEVGRVSRDVAGQAFRNPNDITADGQGGVWISDPGPFSKDVRAQGYVVHIDAQGAARRVSDVMWYPNGVFFEAATNTLYVSEHLTRKIWRFDVVAGGGLSGGRVFADLNVLTTQRGDYREAGPDGLEVGPDGNLYVALYGEGRILRLSKDGALLGSTDTGLPYNTNLAFGPDGKAAVTGAFENDTPPFPGEVRWLDLLP